jgi:hypothetical protein
VLHLEPAAAAGQGPHAPLVHGSLGLGGDPRQACGDENSTHGGDQQLPGRTWRTRWCTAWLAPRPACAADAPGPACAPVRSPPLWLTDVVARGLLKRGRARVPPNSSTGRRTDPINLSLHSGIAASKESGGSYAGVDARPARRRADRRRIVGVSKSCSGCGSSPFAPGF